MGFLWGFLMFFGCHTAINFCLNFSKEYRTSNQGMDLYAAIGAGASCVGAIIFAFSFMGSVPALLIGGGIGFCTGGLHFYISNRSKRPKTKLSKKAFNDLYELMIQMFQAQETADKLQRIVDNFGHTEVFSKKEIAYGLINLQQAQSRLSSFEYFYIYKLWQRFTTDNSQRLLNHRQYLDWCDDMISHFDMVAPYYKYCGDDSMELLGSMVEEQKKPFRARAVKLLESGKLFAHNNWSFSEEWKALNRKFKDEFYSHIKTEFIDNHNSAHSNFNKNFDD